MVETHARCPARSRWAPCFALIATMIAAAGCQVFDKPPEAALEKLFRPVTTSPESVTLEVFHARIPVDKKNEADGLWDQIDEQRFDVDLRRRLVANGLRAGVVGTALPDRLAELLTLQCESPEAKSEQVLTNHASMPRVTRRVVQLNRREQGSIQASELRAEAQVLLGGEGQLEGGGTFRQVQGVYSLEAEAIEGQRVRLRMIPELHHGDLRNRYVGGDQGRFLMMPSREREVYDQLCMEAELAPGELLVLDCLPDASASLGGVFHTAETGGRRERKLILVRLLEVPPSEILAAK